MPLTCIYSQSRRTFVCTNEQGQTVINTQAYSGTGQGRNNPVHNNTRNVGPTPRGNWRIGRATNHAQKGPNTIQITHVGGEAFPAGRDRGTFLIHGDNRENDASQGCIILGPANRQRIISNGGGTITVTR